MVVVGTGVAGLTAALTTAAAGLSVLLITKGRPEEASTQWAQGGVAVVRDERDPGDSIATTSRTPWSPGPAWPTRPPSS